MTASEQPRSDPLPLNDSTLASYTGPAARPAYDRATLKQSIVHIGVGGFHRAHQAVYLDDLAALGNTEWGECGVGLRQEDQRMASVMRSQDRLYTVVTRNAAEESARVIGSMSSYLFAPASPSAVLDVLAHEDTRIVTLTITEGSYKAEPPTLQEGRRDEEHPGNVFDYLSRALDTRRKTGRPPFTVLSCDNVPNNGEVAKKAVLSWATSRDTTLARWIEEQVAFPSSMVDRITPQTTDADRAMVRTAYGIIDGWPVMTEPFRQWVIQDIFCNGRPPLDDLGVQFVSNVEPYETMKLRLLNASHSAMGHLGSLAGYHYIHDVIGDEDFQPFIQRLMDDEVTPLLRAVPGIDLTQYKQTLLERFRNPKIGDTVERICGKGSDKIPKFILPSLHEAIEQQRPHRLLTLAVAGWCCYLSGIDDQKRKITIVDPRARELRERAITARLLSDPRPLLALHDIFGALDQHDAFVAELTQALVSLYTHGVSMTLYRYLYQSGLS